jgi:hypothetical protein
MRFTYEIRLTIHHTESNPDMPTLNADTLAHALLDFVQEHVPDVVVSVTAALTESETGA